MKSYIWKLGNEKLKNTRKTSTKKKKKTTPRKKKTKKP